MPAALCAGLPFDWMYSHSAAVKTLSVKPGLFIASSILETSLYPSLSYQERSAYYFPARGSFDHQKAVLVNVLGNPCKAAFLHRHPPPMVIQLDLYSLKPRQTYPKRAARCSARGRRPLQKEVRPRKPFPVSCLKLAALSARLPTISLFTFIPIP